MTHKFTSSIFPHGWSYAHNCDCTTNGRIGIGWDTSIWNYRVLSSTTLQITFQAVNKGDWTSYLSFVYGAYSTTQRDLLWQDLRLINIAHGLKPWALLGDFNPIRYMDEKLGGANSHSNNWNFNKLIDDLSMSDIRSTGNF